MNRARRLLERGTRRSRELALLRKELRAVHKELRHARRHSEQVQHEHSAELERIVDILRLVYDDEPGTRRRLYELREDPDYELAFSEPDPLVSVVIPTFDRPQTLAQRSIPSALAQTHRNLEVLVVGDGAGEDVAEVVAGFDDPRVRYTNRNLRGPYPSDPRGLRAVAGGPPFNEGQRQARGRWIAALADDDAFRPDHVELLLRAAQQERYEVSYGLLRCVLPDGTERQLGGFPPRRGSYYAQAALYHTGLRFMESELADALFWEASDISLCRRMLRAGVRFGFIDEVVTDYWWQPRYEGAKPPKSDLDNKKPPLGRAARGNPQPPPPGR